jgi:hypothetical protein
MKTLLDSISVSICTCISARVDGDYLRIYPGTRSLELQDTRDIPQVGVWGCTRACVPRDDATCLRPRGLDLVYLCSIV